MRPKTCPFCNKELEKFYVTKTSKTLFCQNKKLSHNYIWHQPVHSSKLHLIKYRDIFSDFNLNYCLEITYYRDNTISSEIFDYNEIVDGDHKSIKKYQHFVEINEDLFDLIKNYRML